ncbi:hypothetical protein M2163_000370 [Streptomyces sp. SAI-135]|nr:hypothetical protein [Streptomyces sp. SAI-090]MDH6613262.1 hypothetical protein [Streptomyces sp. SAI-135]
MLSNDHWSLLTSARQGEAGARYEAVEGVRSVLQALEPVTDEDFEPVEGRDGEVGKAAFDVCPHALDGVEVSTVLSENPDLRYPDPARVVGPSEHRPLSDGLFRLPPPVPVPLDAVVPGRDPGGPPIEARLPRVGVTIRRRGIVSRVHGDLQELGPTLTWSINGGRTYCADSQGCHHRGGCQSGQDCSSYTSLHGKFHFSARAFMRRAVRNTVSSIEGSLTSKDRGLLRSLFRRSQRRFPVTAPGQSGHIPLGRVLLCGVVSPRSHARLSRYG